ncbi:MAG: ABC transporter ATP-binding protein [Nitrospirae bacterium]|jgi:lipoprotein-releasing system ATP-binding protein|nr:ABC transporter ATP-binding protein [Nitrospirota bacterium]MCL5284975.1 ABC transporter ATP-binding protein [Nitrospirota bacterium]
MGGLAVEVKNVSRSYRRAERTIDVLRNLTTSLPSGSFTVLTGPSGAGKSTLLHLLGTLDRPTEGEILYDGRSLVKASDRELASFRNARIGFIFQFHHLLPEFTALENVLMPTWIAGGRENADRAKTLLGEVGLEHRLDHKPSELSGGEQQRVAVARALIMDPALLLADEPTGNLDSHTSLEVFTLLRTLSERQAMTCLVATHNEVLARMASRHLAMDDGVIVSATVT